MDLLLDTDIGTDVDDALALAYAIRHPGIRLRGVSTVSGDATRRAQLAAKLLHIGDRPDVPVAAGIGGPVPAGSRSPWHGHEGEGLLDPGERLPLAPFDGPELLLREAAGANIATIGLQSNVAAALDRDPQIAERVGRVAVMGGMFRQVRLGDRVFLPRDEHNLNLDGASALRSLNAGLPLLYVPSDVTWQTRLMTVHLDALRRGDALCRSLAGLTERWSVALRRRGRSLGADEVAVLHDPLAVACLVDDRFVSIEQRPITVAQHAGAIRTFVDPLAGVPADIVTAVAAQDFADHWLEVVTGRPS